MALRLRGLGTNANQNVSDFLRLLGECVGLEVFLDENGNVRRAAGPPTPANGPMTRVLDDLTGDANTLTISVGRGQSDVVMDRFDRREVDLDDLDALPEPAPQTKPDSFTRCEALIHFLAEYLHALQRGRTTGNRGYSRAHREGRRAQNRHRQANGQGGNANSLRGNRAQTRGRIRYSNGTTTTLDLQDGNITGVR